MSSWFPWICRWVTVPLLPNRTLQIILNPEGVRFCNGLQVQQCKEPSFPHQLGHGTSAFESSSQDKLERGRRVGSEMGVVTAVAVSMLCQQGKLSEAVGALECLAQTNFGVSQSLFHTVLKVCTDKKKDLVVGRRVHDPTCQTTVQCGARIDVFVGNCLVAMNANVAKWEHEHYVVTRRNAMIAAYARQGLGQAVSGMDKWRRRASILADHVAFTFACLLKAFASTAALQQTRQLHSQIVKRGLLDDVAVGTCRMDMYAKCGELVEASQIFDSLKEWGNMDSPDCWVHSKDSATRRFLCMDEWRQWASLWPTMSLLLAF